MMTPRIKTCIFCGAPAVHRGGCANHKREADALRKREQLHAKHGERPVGRPRKEVTEPPVPDCRTWRERVLQAHRKGYNMSDKDNSSKHVSGDYGHTQRPCVAGDGVASYEKIGIDKGVKRVVQQIYERETDEVIRAEIRARNPDLFPRAR